MSGTNLIIETSLLITCKKNPPATREDFLNKLSIILDEYQGFVHAKSFILYLYTLTALSAKTQVIGGVIQYKGAINGPYRLKFDVDMRENPLKYNYTGQDSGLEPTLSVIFSLSVKTSMRSGLDFDSSVVKYALDKMSIDEYIAVVKKYYGISLSKTHQSCLSLQ